MPFGAGILRVELACERAQAAEATIVVDRELPVVAVELGAVPERGVAAGGLGVDERDLREREQLVGAADVLEVADARRGGEVADPFDRGGGERATCPLGGDPAVQAFGLGEDPAEVVGREPGDELAVPDGRGEAAADLRQHPVAGEAPVLGVDPLEAVDVDEDERERAFVALCAAGLGAQLLVEGAVVGEVRERVACRERGQLGARVGERDGRLCSERELEQPDGVAAFGDKCAPEPGADADGSCAGAGLAGPEDLSGGVVSLERDGRAGDEASRSRRGSQAPTIVPKPPVSKRTTAAASTPRSKTVSSATMEKSSTASGSSATASWIRCSAVRAVKAAGPRRTVTMPATNPSSSRRASRRPSSTT